MSTTSFNFETLPMEFTAVRSTKSATIMLNDFIKKVFPLFGPVREMGWADGWSPEILYGREEVAEHMIFRTQANGGFYQWIITQYDPHQYKIEYTVTAPNRVWFITIECREHQSNTLATITYSYTGLSEEGHQLNRSALQQMFACELNDWEEAINYYLKTGKKLKQ